MLLDEAGCRGLAVGGARFSEKHANFVENMGEATTADVIALMAEGRRRVRERFGVELEPEVQFLGAVDADGALVGVSARGAVAGRVPARRGSSRAGAVRLALLAVLVARHALIAAGYTFWLRNSSLVQVENVTVAGRDRQGRSRASAPRSTAAAREQTTLNADPAALARAVAAYPDRRVDPGQPGLPARDDDPGEPARAGRRSWSAAIAPVPTAADGTFLADAEGRNLPRVELRSVPAGPRLGPGNARAAVAVAGAIPPALAARVKTIEHERRQGRGRPASRTAPS